MGAIPKSLVWLALFRVVVLAQSSDVQQCVSSYNWTINSLGQTPCLVASYLESGCGTPTKVDAIPPGTHYVGATADNTNGCYCSSVTYSLMSACAGCQERSYLNWTTWSYNCSTLFVSAYPGTVGSTPIPSWAYLDITETNNNFDPVVAARNASVTIPVSISSTPSPPPSKTIISGLTSSTGTSSTISHMTSPPSKSSNKNVGAIVGITLGAAAGVGIIVVVAIAWYLKRRSNGTQKDLVFDRKALFSGPSTAAGNSSLLVRDHGTSFQTSMQDTTTSPALTSTSLPNSPYSTSRRSLDGPSPSIMFFGNTQQGNLHQAYTTNDQRHFQV